MIYQSIFTNLTSQLDATVNFNYAAVGSGAGARGVLCNSGSQVPFNGVNPTVVHYGASDNPLAPTQVTDWRNSTDGTQCVPTQPDPSLGYPIVGYTTVILPTCFQDGDVVNGIFEFLGLIYGAPDYISLIQQQGFVQLPTALVGIISANILNNNNGFNIDIQDTNICKQAGGSTYVGR